jgi:hypothetical protein
VWEIYWSRLLNVTRDAHELARDLNKVTYKSTQTWLWLFQNLTIYIIIIIGSLPPPPPQSNPIPSHHKDHQIDAKTPLGLPSNIKKPNVF